MASMPEGHQAEMQQIPRNAIALPELITGYPKQKEVLVWLPAWSFENEKDCRQCWSHFGDAQHAASILSAVQYFFKEGRSGGVRFAQEDISNMCCDALMAYWLVFEGVHEVAQNTMINDSDCWAQ
jgi:hypothetical protein